MHGSVVAEYENHAETSIASTSAIVSEIEKISAKCIQKWRIASGQKKSRNTCEVNYILCVREKREKFFFYMVEHAKHSPSTVHRTLLIMIHCWEFFFLLCVWNLKKGRINEIWWNVTKFQSCSKIIITFSTAWRSYSERSTHEHFGFIWHSKAKFNNMKNAEAGTLYRKHVECTVNIMLCDVNWIGGSASALTCCSNLRPFELTEQ